MELISFYVLVSLSVISRRCIGLSEEFPVDTVMEFNHKNLAEVPIIYSRGTVRVLNLSNNKIARLKKSDWEHYYVLETLYLSRNEILRIESGDLPIPKLKYLDLSINRLTYIHPKVFEDTPILEYVNLRQNPIKSLEFHSKSVLFLDLSFCPLELLSAEAFSGFPRLLSLNISYNNITEINLNLFSENSSLISLDLRNNKCNVHSAEVMEILKLVSSRRKLLGLSEEDVPKNCKREFMENLSEMYTNKPADTTTEHESGFWSANKIVLFCALPLLLGVSVFISIVLAHRFMSWIDSNKLVESKSNECSDYSHFSSSTKDSSLYTPSTPLSTRSDHVYEEIPVVNNESH